MDPLLLLLSIVAGVSLVLMGGYFLLPVLGLAYLDFLWSKLYRIEDRIDALYERQNYLQDQMRSVEFVNNNIEYTHISKTLEELALEYCKVNTRIKNLSKRLG